MIATDYPWYDDKSLKDFNYLICYREIQPSVSEAEMACQKWGGGLGVHEVDSWPDVIRMNVTPTS